ncbi:OpgC family protein [Oceaniglobus ichthyenteri]|uniref:OpgC family protein n=1 Tax=Oceaniglobus ichthyenteri TaxID=2136177 RepID=UPI000D3C8011|nr:OpgC domain-containing protein [Oceaniglobus ichthyenteri]
MTLANPTDFPFAGVSTPVRVKPAARFRDPRLDFYRGIAMFIILASHTPNNFFSLWIPARWGFSDATEIFVFCSGMASAIAFGASFDSRGWRLGTARVGYRVWQVYWAHLGMFVVIAAMLAAIDQFGDFETVYIGTLNLWKFFADPGPQLVGLVTLTYVPNYFDILPMYMVLLAMIPVVMALSKLHVGLVFGAMAGLWIAAQGALWVWWGGVFSGLSFPAEPWSERRWFFNPFAWQLVFFTGFALMRGWIPAPPVRIWLIALCAVLVVANIIVSNVGFRFFELAPVRATYIALTGCAETGFGRCNPVFDFRQAFAPWFDKSNFGILRYVQFLALAYLAWVVAGPQGVRLRPVGEGRLSRVWATLVAWITKVGQQSLAVFLFSMVLARFSGFVMDQTERTAWNMTLANFIGFGLLIALAYGVAWIKSQPWRDFVK